MPPNNNFARGFVVSNGLVVFGLFPPRGEPNLVGLMQMKWRYEDNRPTLECDWDSFFALHNCQSLLQALSNHHNQPLSMARFVEMLLESGFKDFSHGRTD